MPANNETLLSALGDVAASAEKFIDNPSDENHLKLISSLKALEAAKGLDKNQEKEYLYNNGYSHKLKVAKKGEA